LRVIFSTMLVREKFFFIVLVWEKTQTSTGIDN